MNSTSTGQLVSETSPTEPVRARKEGAMGPLPQVRACPGNAPQTVWDYLMYPRILLTAIICAVSTVLHIGFGIYIWLFAN